MCCSGGAEWLVRNFGVSWSNLFANATVSSLQWFSNIVEMPEACTQVTVDSMLARLQRWQSKVLSCWPSDMERWECYLTAGAAALTSQGFWRLHKWPVVRIIVTWFIWTQTRQISSGLLMQSQSYLLPAHNVPLKRLWAWPLQQYLAKSPTACWLLLILPLSKR